jgi:carbonic anhydrase/acetyltransferase-like protein (isoleucine patch superfamily)
MCAGSGSQYYRQSRVASAGIFGKSPCYLRNEEFMPVYALEGNVPVVPASKRYWIAPDATVIGKIQLEEDASIWFGSILRGDNERIFLGARSNIQDGCALHTDMGFPLDIGPDCTIGHKVMLHGCTIAENSLIGMGAVILNGAKIGRNCLVGAHALVTEGKEFPDNSLIVGSPARVIRTLDEASAVRIRETAVHYVRNWQRFAVGLVPVDL